MASYLLALKRLHESLLVRPHVNKLANFLLYVAAEHLYLSPKGNMADMRNILTVWNHGECDDSTLRLVVLSEQQLFGRYSESLSIDDPNIHGAVDIFLDVTS